jgi:hypothetical protein
MPIASGVSMSNHPETEELPEPMYGATENLEVPSPDVEELPEDPA